jgi:L-aminopeptidase/D-esterase-like protein
MKGGLGSASTTLADGTIVGALVVVNAFGNIIDPETRQVIAGGRDPLPPDAFSGSANLFSNTTIAVVATNASLTKEEVNKVAQMAHNGLAEVIRPTHTFFDGDTVFALALGSRTQHIGDLAANAYSTSMIGAAAAKVLAQAILSGVRHASDLHDIPATRL